MKAVLAKSGVPLIESVETASSLLSRMRGLLGRAGLPAGQAMHITSCGSIHTFCMRFALDLLFLDDGNRIIKSVYNVPPGRMVLGGPGAHSVLEMSAGWFDPRSVTAGDVVEFLG